MAQAGQAVAGPPVPVIDDPAEVTPAWMTGALRAGGTDAEVTDLRFEAIGSGQLGASYRFHLQARPGPDTPASVVVKLAAGSAQARDIVTPGYRSEIGFYRSFAAATRLRIPRCWSAGISDDGRTFTLVLEDAYPAEPGRQVDGCTLTQATVAVRNLAGLHAPFWNQAGLQDGRAWLRRSDATSLAFLGGVHVPATAAFVERFGAELAPRDADTLRRAAELMPGWNDHLGGRHSLIHGDYRLDNLLFAGEDVVTAVDWQSLEVGFPGRDLAYFLSTALSPALRRSHEAQVVAAYHRQLVAYGVPDYPIETCFLDYRLGMLQGPLITVLGCVYATGERSTAADQMFLSMATNACAAIRDLGTLELLSA